MPGECQSYDVRSKDKMKSSGFAELKSRFWCSGQTTGRGCYKGREFWRAVEGYPRMPASIGLHMHAQNLYQMKKQPPKESTVTILRTHKARVENLAN